MDYHIIKGKISNYLSSWGSGIAALSIKDEEGNTNLVYGDSGPLSRCLIRLFDCYGGAHNINVDRLKDKPVIVAVDDMDFILQLQPDDGCILEPPFEDEEC